MFYFLLFLSWSTLLWMSAGHSFATTSTRVTTNSGSPLALVPLLEPDMFPLELPEEDAEFCVLPDRRTFCPTFELTSLPLELIFVAVPPLAGSR